MTFIENIRPLSGALQDAKPWEYCNFNSQKWKFGVTRDCVRSWKLCLYFMFWGPAEIKTLRHQLCLCKTELCWTAWAINVLSFSAYRVSLNTLCFSSSYPFLNSLGSTVSCSCLVQENIICTVLSSLSCVTVYAGMCLSVKFGWMHPMTFGNFKFLILFLGLYSFYFILK